MRPDQRQDARGHDGRKSIHQEPRLPKQQADSGLKNKRRHKGQAAVVLGSGQTLQPKFLVLSLVSIALLGLIVYANSFSGQFLWDDWHLIADNTYIHSISFENIKNIFSQNIMAGAGREGSSFRPLQMMTYLLDYSLWEKNVFGYHLTSMAWHILAAWAVFYLSFLLCGDKLAAVLASGLFVIHPVHTEAVTYMSGRADSLAAFFVLVATACYVKALSSDSRRFKMALWMSYVLALMSRENSLVFVLVPLLYHVTLKKTWSWKVYWPVLSITVLYILLRLTMLGMILPEPEDTTFLQRVPGFLIAVAKYLGLLLFPRGLHMEYGDGVFPLGQPLAMAGSILLLGVVFFFLRMRRRAPLVAFAIGWFLLFLAPHTNLAPINAYMAEHWLYLPSLGFFLLVGVYFAGIFRDKTIRPFAMILLSVWAIFLCVQTVRQNAIWRSPDKFYEYTLKYAPDSARIRNNLAMIYSAQGRLEEALEQCRLAMKMNSGELSTYNTLASILLKQNRDQEAVEVSLAAIKIDPSYVKIYNQLAIAYIKLGRVEEAIQACETAIALKPKYAKPRDILGAAYMDQGLYDKAQTEYHKALELNPRYPEGWHNLGILYQRMGQPNKAVDCFQKAVSYRPTYVKGYWSLGRALSAADRDLAAVKAYEKASRLAPKRGEIYLDMAKSYFRMKQYRQSREAFEQAQKRGATDPGFLELLDQAR